MVLPIALGLLAMLTVSVMAVLDYSDSNARASGRSKGDKVAFALAEAGINNAVAVLSRTGNNNTSQTLLPACTTAESSWRLNDGNSPAADYEGGDVRWCGTWDAGTAVWWVTATGIVRNPNGNKEIRRTLKAKIPVTPILTQPLVNQSWNYLFSTRTGTAGGCDLTFSNNVTIGSNVYAMGNLCLDQNVVVQSPKMIVLGTIHVENNGRIGTPGTNNWSTRSEVQVGGSGGYFCKYAQQAWTTASSNPFCGDPDRVYSKNAAGTAMTVSPNPEAITPPTADWDGWYNGAIPGPKSTCTTTSGTVPVFDNDSDRDPLTNGSVTTVFDLTPVSSSYTCRVGPADSPLGQVSWNHSTKKLTMSGTIFIDGSVKAVNTSVVDYDGYSTMYITGTFLMDNGAKLCAVVKSDGSDCDYAGWDPNQQMITMVANGSGAIAGAGSQTDYTNEGGGNSIKLANNVRFQGALFGTNAIQLVNNSKVDGPMIGSTVVVDNNVTPDAFPTITEVPAGMPGNNSIYAQTESPEFFSG